MLFDVKKYKPEVTATHDDAGIVDESAHLAAPSEKAAEVVNLVDHGRTIHWLSWGHWSMHHMLRKLLEKTGPADVWISSYAFSEKPARIVCDLKSTGIIKKLSCIIDSRVDVRSASALAMLRNACDELKLCNTHAKLTVIKNDDWYLVAGGSANYTSNKRIETGYISADAGVADYYRKMIIDELTKI